MRYVRCSALALLAVVTVKAAAAQSGLWPADSMLAEGRLATAESLYYAAARERPRDPRVRAALGRFLASRGGTRAGAVLLEEARFFGGDSAALARTLVPLYTRLADYEALAALRPDVLAPAERRRARWLAGRRQEARLRDTVVVLTYRPISDGRGIGTILVRLGRAEFPAIVDPRISGLVVPAAARRDVRTFGTMADKTIGVTESLRIGPVIVSNVPTLVGNPDEAVRIGFDVLAPYYPGFDPVKGVLLLRRVGRRAPDLPGIRVPALYDSNGIRLLIGGRWQPTTGSGASMLLATRRWIWDWRMGDVVLAP